jgi:hypothetical protein
MDPFPEHVSGPIKEVVPRMVLLSAVPFPSTVPFKTVNVPTTKLSKTAEGGKQLPAIGPPMHC